MGWWWGEGLAVGDSAVIGTGSVVTKDVPPYAVVVWDPARVLKYRFSEEVIARLLRLEWWNMPDEFLRKHVSVFRRSLTEKELNFFLIVLRKWCYNSQNSIEIIFLLV